MTKTLSKAFSMFGVNSTHRLAEAQATRKQINTTEARNEVLAHFSGSAYSVIDLKDRVNSADESFDVLNATITDAVKAELAVLDKLEPPSPFNPKLANREQLDEYERIAAVVGLVQPDIKIELLIHFLIDNGITIFPLADVVKYMNEKFMREGQKEGDAARRGWNWFPLRRKDCVETLTFGSSGEWVSKGVPGTFNNFRPASDYYKMRSLTDPLYQRQIPLHALKKVEKIATGFKYHEDVRFFVNDYAPEPQYVADPFLMAVIENPRVAEGYGRLVIDFWDEPGFGLDQQIGLEA